MERNDICAIKGSGFKKENAQQMLSSKSQLSVQ